MSECDKLQNFWFGCCDCERVENCEAASVIKLLAESIEVTEDEKYVIQTNLAKDIDGSPWRKVTFWIRG
jgi:hypothetical protein